MMILSLMKLLLWVKATTRVSQCYNKFSLSKIADHNFDTLVSLIGSVVRRTIKYYSDDTKQVVYAMLLEGVVDGRLLDRLSLKVYLAMDVSQRCVQHIWIKDREEEVSKLSKR